MTTSNVGSVAARSWGEVDTLLADAVAGAVVPGLVAVVGNKGGLLYESAWGYRDASAKTPMTTNTMFRVASQAKLPTAIAVLRLVEREAVSLSTPVGDVLPAFDELQVLEGFDGRVPVMRPPKSRATIEQLLTHTSGLGYDIWDRKLKRYYLAVGQPSLATGKRIAFTAPLVDDPGARFRYSMSMDWAGLVVEAVEGRALDEVLRSEIFGPLGMSDTINWMTGERRSRAGHVHVRSTDGNWVPTGADYYLSLDQKPEFYAGGHSLYSTAGDYLRLQRAILNAGSLDGATVLSPVSVEGLFEDHLGPLDCGVIETADPAASLEVDLRGKKWSLGLLLDVQAEEGMRAAGTAGWAGGFNSFYWIDRQNDVAAALYTQTLPFWDPAVLGLYRSFEAAAYRALSA